MFSLSWILETCIPSLSVIILLVPKFKCCLFINFVPQDSIEWHFLSRFYGYTNLASLKLCNLCNAVNVFLSNACDSVSHCVDEWGSTFSAFITAWYWESIILNIVPSAFVPCTFCFSLFALGLVLFFFCNLPILVLVMNCYWS